MRYIVAMAGLLLFGPTSVTAQTLRDLKPGDRLYIQSHGHGEKYQLERLSADTLFVLGKQGGPVRPIRAAETESIRVRVAHSAGRGALTGALIGGSLGAVIGAVIAVASPQGAEECGQFQGVCESTVNAAKVIGYTGAVAMLGLVVGAGVGAAAPGASWKPVAVELPLSLRIDPVRGTLSIRLARSF